MSKVIQYRVPIIEEFVDGFRFQVYSEGCDDLGVEDFMGWYEYVMGGNNWRSMEDIKCELELGNIRVKV